MFENTMTKNFLKPGEGKTTQVQKARRVPIEMNPRRPTVRHIIIKMPSFKDKERILKPARKKQVTCQGPPRRLAADCSTETQQTTREWL